MNKNISEDDMNRLINASYNSILRTNVENLLTRNFRSMHYLSSKLLCDCIVLNVLLNRDITYNSADKIITAIRRTHRSFYTTVNNAYIPVEERFTAYAKDVLGADYERTISRGMRLTNFIVYVVSVNASEYDFPRSEIICSAYNYEELIEGKAPIY